MFNNIYSTYLSRMTNPINTIYSDVLATDKCLKTSSHKKKKRKKESQNCSDCQFQYINIPHLPRPISSYQYCWTWELGRNSQ